jgi:hypothetical protein
MEPEELEEYPEELRLLVSELAAALLALMLALQAGRITLQEWSIQFERELAGYMTTAAMIGYDNAEIPPDLLAGVNGAVAEQMAYIARFKDTIKTGTAAGPIAQVIGAGLLARAGMYVSAVLKPYWLGKTYSLPLPKYPTEDSECGQSCRCRWDKQWVNEANGDCDAYWVVDARAKHCPTCAERGRAWNPLIIRNWKLVNFTGTKELHDEILAEVLAWRERV